MKKCIVTTTINPPTLALQRFMQMKGWFLVVVGDQKTPHDPYRSLSKQGRLHYLDPDMQEEMNLGLSEAIGWNSIQRRNFGFLYAYSMGADVVATVDDDNIPYSHWGDVDYGPVDARHYKCYNPVADPYCVCNLPVWHRGYPRHRLGPCHIDAGTEGREEWDIRADLVDGDVDTDAVARTALDTVHQIFCPLYFSFDTVSPFNSQNTFIKRSVLPYYFLFPGVGRMDDILASYWVQTTRRFNVVYGAPTVYQLRNTHDMKTDLMKEVPYYDLVDKATEGDFSSLPEIAVRAYEIYHQAFEESDGSMA